MPDILVLPFLGLTRLHGLGGIAALQNLHPRLFIGTDDEASFLVEAQRLEIELTDVLRLGLKIGIVAVEPVDAPMRLEVGLFQDTPDAGATDGLQPMLRKRGDQVVQTPPGGGTMIRGRFPGRDRQHLDALRGGKRAAAAPGVGHLAGRGDRAPDSADAIGPLYDAHRPVQWPPEGWMGGLAQRSGGSADSERPRFGEWNGRAQGTPNGRVPQERG